MKRHLIAAKSILLFLILTSWFATAANADTAVENVKVGIIFSPFSNGAAYYGRINPDGGEVEGYFADLFREIEKEDTSLSFVFIPITGEDPDKVFEKVNESGCDLLTGWSLGLREFDKYEMFSQYRPLTFNRLVYVTNDPDTPLVLTMADLAGRKVAVAANLVPVVQYPAEENSVDIELVEIPPQEQHLIVDAVINGDYDAFVPISSLNMYQYDFSKLGISSVSEVDRGWSAGIPWLYLKDKKELADHISETLYNMMKEGSLTELCKSYFHVDVSQLTDDPEWAENLWYPFDNYY